MAVPLISVIVPVYNVENYLARCVDSILNQTLTDFEVILVDDGSTDRSGTVCDEYAAMDVRIKVIHKTNGGLSDARNVGLDNAAGSYISFIDSDDWVSPDYLGYLYSLIRKYDADVVSADYVVVCGNSAQFNSLRNEKVLNGSSNILQFYMKQDAIHRKNDFPVWIKLYKRTVFDNMRFPAGKIYEDNITNFKILKKCTRYVKSTKVVYAYFQRSQSITKHKLSARHLALLDASKEMLSLAESDKKVARLCRRKIAMSYFSLLALYVRFGTDLPEEKIMELVREYRKIKKMYLLTEHSVKIHIASFLFCTDIQLCRKLYLTLSKAHGRMGGGG